MKFCTKVLSVLLSRVSPDKAPFAIDEVTGVHCQVWDTEVGKHANIYRLIYRYVPSDTHKFKEIDGTDWKNAVPVK